MTVLDGIRGPRDLRRLTPAQLRELAAEIRALLVETISRTGGHLGPNLGVVELTIALHRVFDSPRDRILFDTGHQAYVHKLLTGRRAGFERLRQRGGLSGYPSRDESDHDIIENSHASTALSYADGLAKAYELRGERDRRIVAVVGDGALTGGMAWEALNNLAGGQRPVIIVVNDNGRSYSTTVGGLAQHLNDIRTNPRYEQALAAAKTALDQTPVVGRAMYRAIMAVKKGLKEALVPQMLFEDLGLKYIGPVDGHDVGAVERALRQAVRVERPVIVHCLTRKGYGYAPAETDHVDNLHGPGPFDSATGRPVASPATTWTSIFRDEMVAIGRERRDVVAVTAAMLHSTGLDAFAEAFPGRAFDVGIAEQHAVTSAAGLALGGMHPVVAVYATFLNRALDQLLLDVALHRCGVTFVLDRAGVTGDDGASHNGVWDLSFLQAVPGLRLAAPRDGTRLRELLREAVAVRDGPTVVRFPKGAVPPDLAAVDRAGRVEVLYRAGARDVLLVPVGAMAGAAVAAAERLAARSIGATVVDPRWVKPVPAEIPQLAADHRLVITIEDNVRAGGAGSAVAQALRDAAVGTPLRDLGIPARFLTHGKRQDILAEAGLTADGIADAAARALSPAAAGEREPLPSHRR
ncbi:MAG TPA: 1-deoxy-D-xylulose-5-phosphate synthase [bacterium]|nr:1-deoxy-D-xylulose-5-phosphate synthase [bacterium]